MLTEKLHIVLRLLSIHSITLLDDLMSTCSPNRTKYKSHLQNNCYLTSPQLSFEKHKTFQMIYKFNTLRHRTPKCKVFLNCNLEEHHGKSHVLVTHFK